MTTIAPGRYASLDRLPGTSGSAIQRQIATLKARVIARYKLEAVPGRPDELIWRIPTANVGRHRPVRLISIGYGCGTIRIRKHNLNRPRVWAETLDVQPNDGWHAAVFAFLDPFLSDPNRPLGPDA